MNGLPDFDFITKMPPNSPCYITDHAPHSEAKVPFDFSKMPRFRFIQTIPSLFLLVFLYCAIPALGENAEVLVFKSGDKISGLSKGFEEGMVRWEMSGGNIVRVPLDIVDRIEYPPGFATGAVETTTTSDTSPPLEEEVADDDNSTLNEQANLSEDGEESKSEDDSDIEEESGYFSPMTDAFANSYNYSVQRAIDWTKRIEFGGRFLDGNSEQDSLFISSVFERELNHRFVQLETGGQFGRAEGVPTSNRWYANTTTDFHRKGKWILFVTAKNEYDEFENLNYRGIYSGGIGYRFYNEGVKRLITRIGPGATHERFFEPDRIQTTPDLFGEVEFRWPLFDRMEVEHKSTVNPSLEDFQYYRLISNYGISLHLDEESRWNLKLGLRHEFNSRPNDNREKSDFTTNILLVYTRK